MLPIPVFAAVLLLVMLLAPFTGGRLVDRDRDRASEDADRQRCIENLQLPVHIPAMVTEAEGNCSDYKTPDSVRTNIRQHVGTILRSLIQSVQECQNNITATLENLGTFECPAHSCPQLAEVNRRLGSTYFQSGYYWIDLGDSEYRVETPVEVYCNMNLSACNTTSAGWQRVAYLNTSTFESDTQCPGDCVRYPVLGEDTDYACGRVRTDAQNQTIDSCCSMRFPVHRMPYTHVSGRVYAYKHTLGSETFNTNRGYDINRPYVDGVSITTALDPDRPREHIWTLTAGYVNPTTIDPHANPGAPPPEATAIVGDSYYCDQADGIALDANEDLTQSPLWDGESCDEPTASCCFGLPWFCKELPQPLNSDIELRVCADGDDDQPVFLAEIYINYIP